MQNNTNKKSTNFILVLIFVILSLATVSKVYNKYLDNSEKVFSSQTIDKEFEFQLKENNNDLELKGVNGKIKIEGYEGSELLLKASYIPKEKGYEVDFYKDNNKNFILNYDETKFKSVSVDVLVPEEYFKDIEVSSIDSNSSINNIFVDKLKIQSMNGNIDINSFNGKDLYIENMNGKISLKDTYSKDFEVNNMNGDITIEDFDIRDVKIQNVNSDVNIATTKMLYTFDTYNWKVENQNGKVKVDLVEPNNAKYKINAETTNNEITINKNNLVYSENTPKKVIAKIDNPSNRDKNLNLSLNTTNSSIVIN